MYSREEIKQLRKDFWTMFGKRCEVHPQLMHKKRKWILHQTKISNVALKFEVGRKNAQVMIEITHRRETRRLEAFETIEKYKVLLEEGFEEGLTWDFCFMREDSYQEVCRIYHSLEGVDLHRQHQWPDIYNYFIEAMIKLESNFLEIRDLVKEELKKK